MLYAMAQRRRRSNILDTAQVRLSGLRSIDPALDLGSGLSLQDYANLIATSRDRLQSYHLALAEADRTRIEFAETEAMVAKLSSRILSAVLGKYGRDSMEYEMAGGTPPRNYKRAKQGAESPLLTNSASASAPAFQATANGNGALMPSRDATLSS